MNKKDFKKNKISVVIIALNEEKKIGECLRSVKWSDEIVLVDSGSNDKTIDIAKGYGGKVVVGKGGNYSQWRNEGLKKAKGEWILYIDADERVTPELKNEIISVVDTSKYNAYAIPRRNIVLGKELRHGGFGKFDYVKRLFKKDKLRGWVGELHEEPEYYNEEGKLIKGGEGNIGHLRNKMLHIKAQSLSEMVEKTNLWSEVEAKLMYESRHPKMNIMRFGSSISREIWFRFVRHKAFLDGTVGIIHGIYQVFSRFISYAKLWELQIRK